MLLVGLIFLRRFSVELFFYTIAPWAIEPGSCQIISARSEKDDNDHSESTYRVGQRNPEKTYDDISDLYLRNYIKIEHFMIIFMLGYPFLTTCFNLSIPTRVRL